MHVVHVFFNFELVVSCPRIIEDDFNFDTQRLKTNPFFQQKKVRHMMDLWTFSHI